MNNLQATKVYSDAYAMALLIFQRTKSIPKAQRPTLGRSIEEATLELLTALRAASVAESHSQKKHHCLRASDALDRLRIFAQLLKDLNCFSENGYFEISEQSAEVGRQLGGWLKVLKT
jgi:hypothetical protein